MPKFSQVEVFSSTPYAGNPVAVVHDAAGLEEDTMQRLARWTNLSETTFLLPPTQTGAESGADYRVRIFTPDRELPFAGHPTLGSAHAWLEAGGLPASPERLVQECGAGLVPIRRADRLAFAAPPLLRSGPLTPADRAAVCRGLRIAEQDIVDAAWIDNGPGWVAILLRDAAAVLAVRPDAESLRGWDIGILGPQQPGADTAIEVRALFTVDDALVEDPATGSLNAGIAQWLAGSRLPTKYVAAQGTVLGREGRVFVEAEGTNVWVGGDTATRISGELHD